MNKFSSLLIFVLMCCNFAFGNSKTTGMMDSAVQSMRYVRHIEKRKEHSNFYHNCYIPSKQKRSSSKAGNIKLIYNQTLPDSIQTALQVAKKLWEANFFSTLPILISIEFDSLEDNTAMYAESLYMEGYDLEGCPTALASQLSGIQYGSVETPDGIIVFNSDVNWNCKFTAADPDSFNLTTMALRGIARCLGFGSSIYEEAKERYFYSYGWPTYYDKLLKTDTDCLLDLEEGSQSMANFIQSNQVFASGKNGNHKIYAPSQFDLCASLNYLESPNTLMSYNLGRGNIHLSIDDDTNDILQKIGWDLPSDAMQIKCHDITTDGLGSGYKSHVFYLDNASDDVSNYHWTFSLKNKTENFQEIESGYNKRFTIPTISNPQNYYININGDLEGKIVCDYP